MSVRVEWPTPGIAVVVIDAPETNNALTKDMLIELAGAFRGLRENTETRVAVLTGAGTSNFCAGIDLKHAHFVFKMDEFDFGSDPVYQMEHATFPIIGAVRGHAINAGFEIALACDILLCDATAQFLDTHAKLGLIPSWGLSSKLNRIIGPGAASRASLACRAIRAQEAKERGLVVEVVGGGRGDRSDKVSNNHSKSLNALSNISFKGNIPKDALMAEALGLAIAIAKNKKSSVARIKRGLGNSYSKPFGEARSEERKGAFVQYRALPEAFFKKMKQAAGLKPRAKL